MNTRNFRRRAFLASCTAGAVSALAASCPRAAGGPSQDVTPAPRIDCDFPGGNILVERIDGCDVYLRQDQRDTPGFWFYWYFRVRGAAGSTLRFHFTAGNVIGARGPAVSTDGGQTWAWLGMQAVEGATFVYTFGAQADDVRFCLGVPYLEAHLRSFLARHADHPNLKTEPHCTTRKGRKTLRLRVGRLDGTPEHRVLLTCRHHCCEMMASYALEGVLEAVLAETDDGAWLRRRVEVLVVPLVDHDGVEDGDQGKNRQPHDHNRDYLGESIYPSVAALRRHVPKWSQGRLRIALDMHCPWIRGGGDGPSSNERIFLVGNPAPEIWQRQQEFGRVLQQVQTGSLVYDPKHNIPWGQAWNTAEEPRCCSRWTASLPGVLVGVTIEIPYANAGGREVTPHTARRLGHDLARAIRRYLETHAATRTPDTTFTTR
ncbi:MAG: hypothetical protein JXB62_22785 [Pirellulales bacterium]|nr:hypothetical protein [Pirellulales bacterium]